MSDFDTLIQGLNAGKEAIALVPLLQTEKSELQRQLERSQDHAQQLELNIVSYKEQIATLNDRVRSLEVERDDYGFRHAEAEDTVAALRRVLGTINADVVSAMKASEPEPKPEPEAAPQAVQGSTHTGDTGSAWVEPQPSLAPQVHGSSALVYDVPPPVDNIPSPPATLHPEPIAEAKPQPYAGRNYADYPGYVPRDKWIEGGGTVESYDNFTRAR